MTTKSNQKIVLKFIFVLSHISESENILNSCVSRRYELCANCKNGWGIPHMMQAKVIYPCLFFTTATAFFGQEELVRRIKKNIFILILPLINCVLGPIFHILRSHAKLTWKETYRKKQREITKNLYVRQIYIWYIHVVAVRRIIYCCISICSQAVCQPSISFFIIFAAIRSTICPFLSVSLSSSSFLIPIIPLLSFCCSAARCRAIRRVLLFRQKCYQIIIVIAMIKYQSNRTFRSNVEYGLCANLMTVG